MKRFLVLLVVVSMIIACPAYAFGASSQTVTARTEMVKSEDGRWDIRIEAEEAEYGYDTVQGACSHKGYAYMALYNRDVERIKIAKVNLKTMKVEKVSAPLAATAHGNTLTYNTRNNTIICVCGKDAKKRIAIFNPRTMKLTGTRTIVISRKRLGEKYSGINGFAYNAKKNIYLLKVRNKSGRIVILDSRFKVKKVIRPQGVRKDLLAQGLYTEGNYMFDIQSFRGKNYYNLISVRKISNGKLVKRIVVPSGRVGELFELESLFHEGGKWYICMYRADVKPTGDADRKNYLFEIKNMPKL